MALQQMSFGGVSRISYCSRCNKPLSNPVSVDAGMGPICRGHRKGDDGMSDLCKSNNFSDGGDQALVRKTYHRRYEKQICSYWG
jgi:hypothetical protein